MHVRDVPDDLHREVRIAAIQAGETLREFVIAALERELDRRREVTTDKRK